MMMLDRVAEKAASRVADLAVDRAMLRMEERVVGMIDQRAVLTEQRLDMKFQELMAEVNSRMTALSSARSVAAPSITGSVAAAAHGTNESDFIPEHVRVRWYKGYPVPDDQCITDMEASDWLTRLWGKAPPHVELIDREKTKAANSRVTQGQMMLILVDKEPTETSRRFTSRAWDLKKSIDGLVSKDRSLHIHNQPLKLKVQSSPSREAMLSACGKALGTMQRACGIAEADLKPHWVPPKVYFTGVLKDGNRASRPLLLITWSAEAGYGIQEGNLALVTDFAAQELMAELTSGS